MSKITTSVVCLFLVGIHLHAQNTAGTSSITGTVVDATGSAVPGARVVIDNELKGIHRELETTDSGVFAAPALIPAPGYSVTVSKAGFADYQASDIVLNVGQTLTLSPSLGVSASAIKIDVNENAALLDTARSDVSGLVDSRQILDLPINGRRVDNFVLLQPAVTSDAGFGLLTFRGLAGGNSFLTDGIDTTNSFYDENAGRTRTYNISQDAVQEFQVVSSGFLAEFGRASGGVVNTITRSGTNELHGTAYWFFRNRTLNATDISSNGLRPQDWRHQAGASVGGPIKKDKLFYFFNGELQRRDFPIVSSNIQNALFVGGVPRLSSALCGTASPAQCQSALNYVYSRAQPQLVPRTADVNLAFGKIDYQINDRNRATFEANYVDFRSPNGIQTQVSLPNGNAVGNNANTNVFDRTAKAGLTTIFSPSIVNEFKFGYFKDRQYDPNSPSLLPSIGPIGLSITGPQAISNIGYATGYNRLDPSEQRFEVADTLSYTVGTHNLKFGFNYDNTEDYVNQLTNRYPSYSYASFSAFALDFSGNLTGAKNWNTYTQRFGSPIVDIHLNNFAAFLQDEVKVTSKLTLSPGLRWETSILPQPTDISAALQNPALPQTNQIPETRMNFMPRFGAAYAINDKTVFRSGYGVFFNRYPTSSIANFFTNNGVYQASYTLQATQRNLGPVFPQFIDPAQISTLRGTATPAYADLAFRPAYSQQANASIERQLDKTSSFTASYIWSRGLHLLSAYDANAGVPTTSYTYPILNASGQRVSAFTTPLYLAANRRNLNYTSIIAVTSSNNSYYNGLALQYQKRYANWFQAQVSYTYSHAIDDNIGGGGNVIFTPSAPTSVLNGNYSGEKGSASTDQRHRMVANFVASPKFVNGTSWVDRYLINNWQLSSVVVAASAQPLVPTVSVGVGPAGRTASSTLNGLGGSFRVPFESISALDADQQYRTDARLSKLLPITERLRVTLLFEAFNVFNHHFYAGTSPRNTTQYGTTNIGTNASPIYALTPISTYAFYNTSSAPLEGTSARRAQAAIRIEF